MLQNQISKVTIIAVAVEAYQHMRPLSGPSVDVENIHRLFIESPDTAIFSPDQFIEVQNPTSQELRSLITDYALGRSAPSDILIFYFSGHGVALGRNDFGFCTIDSQMHPSPNMALSLTVVRFTDLLQSISIVGVIPIVIIDACYSGTVGNAMMISPDAAVDSIYRGIQVFNASNYGLFCSCSDLQQSIGTTQGGLFSRALFQIFDQGIPGVNTPLIGLREVFQPLTALVETESLDTTPRLYLGDTLPEFPLAKNVLFAPQTYAFSAHLQCVVQQLWNSGNERELSPGQIEKLCGKGTYGNHQKLSSEPWGLVENRPNSLNRRLTERGRQFVKGHLRIPKSIQRDPMANLWHASPGTVEIDITSTQLN